MWKSIAQPDRQQITIQCGTEKMRFARWITKTTNKHSEYIILIAFPRKPLLRERSSALRYAYTDYFLTFHVV
jgi:hypothetical protein